LKEEEDFWKLNPLDWLERPGNFRNRVFLGLAEPRFGFKGLGQIGLASQKLFFQSWFRIIPPYKLFFHFTKDFHRCKLLVKGYLNAYDFNMWVDDTRKEVEFTQL